MKNTSKKTMTAAQSEKAINLLLRWRDSDLYEMRHAYGKFSFEKWQSYENIKNEMREAGGKCLKILGHNCCTYSCAYIKGNENGDTIIVFHTRDNRYEFNLTEAINCYSVNTLVEQSNIIDAYNWAFGWAHR